MNRNGFLYDRLCQRQPRGKGFTRGLILLLLGSVGAPLSAAPRLLAFDDFSHYQGTGLSPVPVTEVDSDDWRFAGFSDGDTAFGSTVFGGDFGRGISTGGVSSGGLYAFDINGDVALGVQPTGSDFTPGQLTRRVQNDQLDALSAFQLEYDVSVRNEGDRSSRWQVDWSLDGGSSWQLLETSLFDTPQTRAAEPDWQPTQFSLPGDLSGLGKTWLPGSDLLLRWSADDLTGSGGRDEVALDNIRVTALPAVSTVPLPPAVWLLLAALASVLHRRRSIR